MWQLGGYTYAAIGVEFDITRERVRQILIIAKEKGYEVRETHDVSQTRSTIRVNAAIENLDTQKFLSLYEAGISQIDICAALDITHQVFKAAESQMTEEGLTSYKNRIVKAIQYEIDNPDELTKYREGVILKMRQQSSNLTPIAETLGISRIRLAQIIKYMKLKGIHVPNSLNTGRSLSQEEILTRVNIINSYLEDGLNVTKIHNITGYGKHSIAQLIYEHLRDT